MLHRAGRPAEALEAVQGALQLAPREPALLALQATMLARLGRPVAAIPVYEALFALGAAGAPERNAYAHALKSAGRAGEAVAAYRAAIAADPRAGQAWWGLANLKTGALGPGDVAAMRDLLARGELDPDARIHVEFALGRALEDAGADAEAFAHYANGNALRRRGIRHDPARDEEEMEALAAAQTAGFFSAREGAGCESPAPIFVVGMPRSGSTLVEQILASHPLVEGTMELPVLPRIAGRLAADAKARGLSPHAALAALDRDALRALGAAYLERAGVYRASHRPRFVDKMPDNHRHAGLIHLILPRATIVDVRRHPMACGWSNFTQLYAAGQEFSYDLDWIGRRQRSYARLMAHFDAVLPDRILRLRYEDLVADPEREVRRLLAHCGLDYAPQCLRFHENARSVATASAQQVRRPIDASGLARWRRFEEWLGPLRGALGADADG